MNHLFVGAVCVIVRKGATVLALRRASWKDAAPGAWEAVSGRMEPGEAPLEAASREVREETSLDVRIDPRPLEAHATDRAGVPMLIVYYAAEWVGGDPVPSDEHDEARWVGADEFASLTTIAPLAAAVRRLLTADR